MEHWKAALKVMSSGDQRLNDHITAIRYTVDRRTPITLGARTEKERKQLAGGAISWKSEKGSYLIPLHTLSILLATRRPEGGCAILMLMLGFSGQGKQRRTGLRVALTQGRRRT